MIAGYYVERGVIPALTLIRVNPKQRDILGVSADPGVSTDPGY